MLRVLTMTTLFPNTASPRHGIFVETRLTKLVDCGGVQVDVIAPTPWFPFAWRGFGHYAQYAMVPKFEERHRMRVEHPRYLIIPKVGTALQPAALAAALWRASRRLLDRGSEFDVIDAHYLYPDAVAAATVAQRLSLPLVVTARGSDVNLIAQLPGPRASIETALKRAHAVLTVSEALRRRLIDLGIPADRVETLRNGVDTEVFAPRARAETRARLKVDRNPLLLSVGNLVPQKGHDLVVRAAARLPAARLVIVGTGPARRQLLQLASECGLQDRIAVVDNMSQEELALVYGAADVLALGSLREGWPNVLLEAMACGTPVVATAVGGVAEILAEASFARIVPTRDPIVFAAALQEVLDNPPDRASVRNFAQRFDWTSVAHRYRAVLAEAAATKAFTAAQPCLKSS